MKMRFCNRAGNIPKCDLKRTALCLQEEADINVQRGGLRLPYTNSALSPRDGV